MNILFIGDVFGEEGTRALARQMPRLRREHNPDVVVVNCENSEGGFGLTEGSANALFAAGADVLTGGNHIFRCRGAGEFLDSCPAAVRPANLKGDRAGRGVLLYDMGRRSLAVINLAGAVFMPDEVDCPFQAADRLLAGIATPFVLVDFHAEATSEKAALGHYLDGRVSAVLGTHTHVQTADACVLPGGTAFITDAGMTGPRDSCLGVDKATVVDRFARGGRERFHPAAGPCQVCGVSVSLDDRAGRAAAIAPIFLREEN